MTTVRVAERWELVDDVVALTLMPCRGRTLPPWAPGAHIDVVVRPGVVRQYSLCGRPEQRDRYSIAVRVDPSGAGGSVAVGALRPGDRLRISLPRNNFELVRAERYLFIAGGIGITPLLPMITQVDDSGAPWRLVYAGRTYASMPFTDVLRDCKSGTVMIHSDDVSGSIDVAEVLERHSPNAEIYCCGPEGLLNAVEEALEPHARGRLHVERFRPASVDHTADRQFELELARSGMSLTVPVGVSILDTLHANGVDVPFSCGEGTCGTCETIVLAGEVDHRDSVLSQAERDTNEFMMLCVSRAAGDRLVLDR